MLMAACCCLAEAGKAGHGPQCCGWQRNAEIGVRMASRKATGGSGKRAAATGRKRKVAATGAAVQPDLAVPSPQKLDREARRREAQWQAESDLRTLRDAEQIRADRRRLSNVSRVAAAEMKALQAIQRRGTP